MKKLLVLSSVLMALSTGAFAEETRKVVASMDITPCSKTTYYKDSLGIRWPTLKFARQTVELVVSTGHGADFSEESFNNAHYECNELALVAAAGMSLATSPAAFKETYFGAYSVCMQARLGGEITGIGVNVESTCHW